MTPELRALHEAYLSSDDPRRQSGFGGDEFRWRMARALIAEQMTESGTFLDLGCANGYLLESVLRWVPSGVEVDLWGVDISPELVELARSRLPEFAQQLFVADVTTWQAPRRFDVVTTLLTEFASPEDRPRYIARLLRDVIAPDGKLLVNSYGSSRRPAPLVEPIDDDLRGWGFVPNRVLVACDPANGIPVTRLVVISPADQDPDMLNRLR